MFDPKAICRYLRADDLRCRVYEGWVAVIDPDPDRGLAMITYTATGWELFRSHEAPDVPAQYRLYGQSTEQVAEFVCDNLRRHRREYATRTEESK